VAREQIERLCQKVVEALREPWISPEECRRMAEAEARKRAEDEARRLEAEAERRAEESRRRAEVEARKRAEDEARRLEAEAERRAEESRRRAEVEARKRAEDEAWRLEAEKLASVAANRVDDVGAVDASLTDQPESNPTIKAPAAQGRGVAGAAAGGTVWKLGGVGGKRGSRRVR